MFVPPDEPAGVYLLTVRNRSGRARRLRRRALLPDGARRAARVLGPAARSAATRRSAPSSSRTRATRTAPARRSSPCRAPRRRVETSRGRFFGRPRRRPSRTSSRAASPSRGPRPTTGRSPPCSPSSTCRRAGSAPSSWSGPGRRPRAGRGRHPQAPATPSRGRRPRRDAGLVAEPDGHRLGPDRQPGVRPLPRLAEVPGAGRADLGAARVLPGERGVRLPRPAPGLGEPHLDGPGAGAAANPPARRAAVPRGGRGPLVPPAPGRPDRVRRPDARLGQPPLAGLGRSSSTSARPATTRSSTERTPVPGVGAALRAPAGREARDGVRSPAVGARGHRLPPLPEGDRPRARPPDGGARPAADGHRRLERRARRDRQSRARARASGSASSSTTSSTGWSAIVEQEDGPERRDVLPPVASAL